MPYQHLALPDWGCENLLCTRADFFLADAIFLFACARFPFANVKFLCTDSKKLFSWSKFINDHASFINAGASFINADASFINADASFINADASFINADASFINADASFINADASFINADASFINADASFINADASFINADASFINADASFINADASFINADASFMNADASFMNADASFLKAGVGFLAAKARFLSIGYNFLSADDRILLTENLLYTLRFLGWHKTFIPFLFRTDVLFLICLFYVVQIIHRIKNHPMYKSLSGLFFLWLLLFTVPAAAQTIVKGQVTNENESPMSGVNIAVKSTPLGTASDANGNFQLQLDPGTYTLEASSVGYKSSSKTIQVGTAPLEVNFVMRSDAIELQELVVLGSRSTQSRTNIDRPAPVDVISQKEVKLYGQNDITQSLSYAAPSFNANRQTIAGATDHIDPASLRGLGPDQVLVMVNGKRRHTTAIVNINGSFGRGSVGTDMNAIPMAAVERIEILRDGAAAQYGSDAIAGVINLVLKKKSPLIVSTTYGQSFTNFLGQTMTDGKNLQFDFTKGFDLGKKGVINISAQYLNRGYTDRGGEDTQPLLYSSLPTRRKDDKGNYTETDEAFQARYARELPPMKIEDDAKAEKAGLSRHNMRVGNSDMDNIGAFVNGEYALSPNLSAYATVGFSHKRGKAAGFYRLPSATQQIDLSIYPNGFLPFINTAITDFSAIAGLRGEWGKWNFDVSNTFGTNIIGFRMTNTLNASLPAGRSPTEFDTGQLSFAQNTFNLDFSRRLTFDRTLTALNLAFGSEWRVDNFSIKEGEELSWSAGWPSKNIDPVKGKAAGAQMFSGYLPTDALNKSRHNVALYADFEQEFGPKLLTEVAGRFEHYSDFGSNFSGKASARWKVLENISLRGALATGFRAPSLHQHYFNNVSTMFVQNKPTQVLTANNDNPVVALFGVGPLKPEISTSYSVGITGKLFSKLIFTLDAFQIDIRDRIVFSSQYRRERYPNNNLKPEGKVNNILNTVDPNADINSVQFFTNAVNTQTRGLDLVVSDKFRLGKGDLTATVAANFNKTNVTSVNPPETISTDPKLTELLFNRRERGRFELGTPRSKINLALTYALSKYSILLRTVRFGSVGYRDAEDPATSNGLYPPELDQVFSAKWITDLVLSCKVLKNLTLTAGANNIFDIYPDKLYIDSRNKQGNLASPANSGYTPDRDSTNNGRFVYSRDAMQFGFNGRYVYGKLTFTL